ncbi:MAG: protein tyrosine phosphatase family protein [Xanthomonadales bacterium]|nr:protein tyrosine phosphatase family protein [Xanthomonadales bacterium]
MIRITFLLSLMCLMTAQTCEALDAPNVVPINDHLVTSGQPSRELLALLGSEGFQAVVYLAPSDVEDAIADEADILRRQGIEFVHVPIVFRAPQVAEIDQVAAALDRLAGKKVLVHCQINMRASTVTFLYRAGYRGENPATAFESVTRVWVPDGAWKQLVIDVLAARGVDFDPF